MPQTQHFDRRIFQEWDALCVSTNPTMPLEEREARANALLDSCLESGAWAVSIQDAGLASYHAIVLALQGKRYASAIDLCNRYLSHPRFDPSDDCEHGEFITYLGSAYILNTGIENGVRVFEEFLAGAGKRTSFRRHLTRNKLISTLRNLDGGARPNYLISQLISNLLKDWKGQARKAKLALKLETTDQLIDLLLSTYPRRDPLEIDG